MCGWAELELHITLSEGFRQIRLCVQQSSDWLRGNSSNPRTRVMLAVVLNGAGRIPRAARLRPRAINQYRAASNIGAAWVPTHRPPCPAAGWISIHGCFARAHLHHIHAFPCKAFVIRARIGQFRRLGQEHENHMLQGESNPPRRRRIPWRLSTSLCTLGFV